MQGASRCPRSGWIRSADPELLHLRVLLNYVAFQVGSICKKHGLKLHVDGVLSLALKSQYRWALGCRLGTPLQRLHKVGPHPRPDRSRCRQVAVSAVWSIRQTLLTLSVSICLSKGLCAPVRPSPSRAVKSGSPQAGGLVAGTTAFIAEVSERSRRHCFWSVLSLQARRAKKALGGAMRQVTQGERGLVLQSCPTGRCAGRSRS